MIMSISQDISIFNYRFTDFSLVFGTNDGKWFSFTDAVLYFIISHAIMYANAEIKGGSYEKFRDDIERKPHYDYQ